MKEKKFSKSLSSKHNVYNNLRKGRRMAAFFVLQKIKLFTSIFQPRMSRMDSNFRACLPTGTADRHGGQARVEVRITSLKYPFREN